MQPPQPDWWTLPLWKMEWWRALLLLLVVVAAWIGFRFLLAFAKTMPGRILGNCLRTCESCRKQNYFWDKKWTWFEGQYVGSDGSFRKRMHKACAEEASARHETVKEQERMIKNAEARHQESLRTRDGSRRFLMSSSLETASLGELTQALTTATENGLVPPDLKLRSLVDAFKSKMEYTYFEHERDGGRRDHTQALAAADRIRTFLRRSAGTVAATDDLKGIRSSYQSNLDDISDMEHDSAHDCASRHGYKAALELLDSLIG